MTHPNHANASTGTTTDASTGASTGVGTEVAELSAVALVSSYANGSLSPVEATRAALEVIDARNPLLNAFCLVDPDGAVAAARQSEDRWRRGEPLGPVDGVPTGIKDMLVTRGWPTLKGSCAIDAAGPWEEDAPAVARLREQGAVLVGKTTTPEMAWKGVTDSPLTGVTRNPWDTTKTPGGSSGGSAAAVAAGMCPLTLGTDGGGSVRIPASFTGTVALKPTYGLVPIYPASPFGTLSHVGPMTRTVEDTAVLLDVIAAFDPRDWSALTPPESSFAEVLTGGVSGLRIAFSPTLGYVEPDERVAASVRAGAEVFAELGAEVTETDPGFTDPIAAFRVLWYSGVAKVLAGFDEEELTQLDPGLAEIRADGVRLSALDYLDATAARTDLGRRMGLFHQRFDLLVTPSVAIPPFTAGIESPVPGTRWMSWTPYSYPFNLTQQPAASVPCGWTEDGLPIGLQIVGARHADALVLRAAKAFQDALGGQLRRPTPR